jgi:hypothetical protein
MDANKATRHAMAASLSSRRTSGQVTGRRARMEAALVAEWDRTPKDKSETNRGRLENLGIERSRERAIFLVR